MVKNIMHELYGLEARKQDEGAENKENEAIDERQENCECESENMAPVNPSEAELICPRCKSKRIKHVINKIYGTTPQRYDCANCGYSGSLVLDVSEHEKSETDIAMEEDLMRIKREMESGL